MDGIAKNVATVIANDPIAPINIPPIPLTMGSMSLRIINNTLYRNVHSGALFQYLLAADSELLNDFLSSLLNDLQEIIIAIINNVATK